MTEEEAKTKWCPFARIAVPFTSTETDKIVGVGSANRVGLSPRVSIGGSTDRSNPESARCLGSACMAWRTSETYGDGSVYRGFCGLAGKP
jgi:hypothetical protein